MVDLTNRQITILKFLIEEYIETAEPVSSDTLDKKYDLGVSPATIRNEMVVLNENGFIKKPHVSAGRIPTSMGLKFYVQNLIEPEKVSVADEVAVKEKVWDYRQKIGDLISEATAELARRTKSMAVIITPDNHFYWSGVANILDFPEFWDIDLTHALLLMLDDEPYWQNLVEQIANEAPVTVLLGDDFGMEILRPCSFIFTRFQIENKDYVIGVVGPGRCHFRHIIPMVNYFGHLITDIGQE